MGNLNIEILVSLLLAIFSISSFANPKTNDCLEYYYRVHDIACLKGKIIAHDDHAKKNGLYSASSFSELFIAAMAQFYLKYPDEVDTILATKVSRHTEIEFLKALHYAGLKDRAAVYASKHALRYHNRYFNLIKVPLIGSVKFEPGATPFAANILIGSFVINGDPAVIERLVQGFSDQKNQNLHDAFRLSLLYRKFGFNLKIPRRKTNILKRLCNKYQCKKKPNNYLYIKQMANALVALRSMSRRHPVVAKVLTEYFKNHPRIQAIAKREEEETRNYMLLLILDSVVAKSKKTNKTKSIESTVAKLENEMNDYESFKTAKFILRGKDHDASKNASLPDHMIASPKTEYRCSEKFYLSNDFKCIDKMFLHYDKEQTVNSGYSLNLTGFFAKFFKMSPMHIQPPLCQHSCRL